VDSAGAPTAVVTPSGEIATSPGAAVGVSELVDVGVGCVVGVGPPSSPDEQPASAMVAAAATRSVYRCIPPIYATLAAVTERKECCRA
jgi:hypothetical protein